MNFFNLQMAFYNDKKNIVLVGETGQGKSTLGNILLKKKVLESFFKIHIIYIKNCDRG